jgi:ADP-ribosylglycohydrolase
MQEGPFERDAGEHDPAIEPRGAGYLASNGRCFDIGGTVAAALGRFAETGDPFAGSVFRQRAGNGSLMRLAPVPLFFVTDPDQAIRRSAESSRTTHGAPQAVDACAWMAAAIVGALEGRTRAEIVGPGTLEPVETCRGSAVV